MTFFLPYITRDALEYLFLFNRSAESVAAMMIHVVMHLNMYIFTTMWHYLMVLKL